MKVYALFTLHEVCELSALSLYPAADIFFDRLDGYPCRYGDALLPMRQLIRRTTKVLTAC